MQATLLTVIVTVIIIVTASLLMSASTLPSQATLPGTSNYSHRFIPLFENFSGFPLLSTSQFSLISNRCYI